MTKHRSEILATLAASPEALSAATLHEQLPHINLVTIYRSLEQFTAQGSVKKLTFDEQEALYEVQEEPHHHALCTECGRVLHFTVPEIELTQEFSVPGFTVRDVEVTVRGVCNSHTLQKQPRAQTKQKQ